MGMVKHVLFLIEEVCAKNGIQSDILDFLDNHETVTIEKSKLLDICFDMFNEGVSHNQYMNAMGSPVLRQESESI
jgi:hypothetical protein